VKELTAEDRDKVLWTTLCRSETDFYQARMAFLALVDNPLPILRQALKQPSQRGTALRVLEVVDQAIREELFFDLMALSTSDHSDIDLVRQAIKGVRKAHRERLIRSFIDRLTGQLEEEEYRRLFELLTVLRSASVATLLERASQSTTAEIQALVDEFKPAVTPETSVAIDTTELRSLISGSHSWRWAESDLELITLLLQGHSLQEASRRLDSSTTETRARLESILGRLRAATR